MMVEVVGTAPTSAMVITKLVYRYSWKSNNYNINDIIKTALIFMSNNQQYFVLSLLVATTLLPKLIINLIYFDYPFLVNTIYNIEAAGYFPIIISFSDLIFNPSYLDNFKETNLIPFPIYGFFVHSLFFKFFGIYSFFILEIIFQFLFLIIFVKVIHKIFKDKTFSLFLCIFIFFIIFFLRALLTYENIFYLSHIHSILNEAFGSRFPRPLFTGIVYFYFFYLIFSFKENLKNFNGNYFIILFFLLAVFLNSFFYYFINFSLLIVFLTYKHLDKNIFVYLNVYKKKIFLVFFSFLIFCLPFLIQLYYGESDYAKRLGVIDVNFEQKLYLLRYYFINFFRIEFLFLITSTILVKIYIQKKFLNFKDQVSNLDNFFYFIIVSILSPPIFFIFSPKLVSIYHFLDIQQFIMIFYLLISLSFIIYKSFKINEKFKNLKFLNFVLIFFILLINLSFDKDSSERNIKKINEFLKIHVFLKNNNFVKSDEKLFTNDKDLMLLWLLNGNRQLTMTWGFVNSHTNKDIEDILITNLKSFGVLDREFESMISLGKSKMREKWQYLIYNYMFQANSLYTYSAIENYTINLREKIIQTSPFRAQILVVPEDEKERLMKKFYNININKNYLSDIIIVNKLKSEPFNNFKFRNKDYNKIYETNSYKIFINKN